MASDEKRSPPGAEPVEMRPMDSKDPASMNTAPRPDVASVDEFDDEISNGYDDDDFYSEHDQDYPPRARQDLHVTEDDILEAQVLAEKLSLEEVRGILKRIYRTHERDPNFPVVVLEKIKTFLDNEQLFKEQDDDDAEKRDPNIDLLVRQMKLEAALLTTNSPYAEVRAVVDNKDDVNAPCSTIRSWAIGLVFSLVLAFINQLFDIRQPTIRVMANVAQLLAYPLGKACETWLPDKGFTFFGIRHSLNPGPFHRKEHMLITIMANVAYNTPYTNYIIWVQYLPQYFNQPYASHPGYQILIALSTNFIGYGMAGICRRFIVYPSYCVWPASLVSIALNSAFHNSDNTPVRGPFGSIWRISRIKFFYLMFGCMFVWFWIPGYLWTGLSKFSWISWIASNNVDLNALVGFNNGLGINPFPTWDWNTLLWDSSDPLMVPFFSTINRFLGAFISMWVVIGIWYSNIYNTGYLPINSNRVFDHFGNLYNVSLATNERGLFDRQKYQEYSPPFLAAGNVTVYLFFFGVYTSTLTYALLYHRHELVTGFKGLCASFRRGGKDDPDDQILDVHHRLMKSYKEVPEWWYFICLVCAIGLGVAGILTWDTHTTPGVVFYGLALCLIFVIPVGIIKAMTGIEVTLNVLAEFIGGSFVEGNALAMNFFKSFGYVTCAHAIWFSNDLKLAHYAKIPPRQTFFAQMVATFVGTLVCVGVLNFQMRHIDGVCTPNAQFRLTCPGVNTFFTASVLWGTVGPAKIWGSNGQYTETLVGFPLGVVVVLVFWALSRKFPKSNWLRQIHPVAIMYGGIVWAPYNMSYIWPSVPIAYLSWIYLKSRFLGFWSKYNFVLSAAWSCGIAIAGIIIFFGLQWSSIEVEWWGNNVPYDGCEGDPCVLKTLDKGEYFGPRYGEFS